MLKRGIVLIFLLLVPTVFAAVSLNYTFNENNVLFDVYRCQGTCSTLELIDSQSISGYNHVYTYQNPGSYFYAAYKTCLFPLANEAPISQDINGMSVDLELTQRAGCSAEIDETVITQGARTIGSNISIRATITGPFLREDFSRPNFLDSLPGGRSSFFDSVVTTKLYINNILISEKNETFFVDQNKDITFYWIPAANGTFNVKIQTAVPDCKCSDSQLFERSVNINIGTQDNSSAQQTTQPNYQSFNIINTEETTEEQNLLAASSVGCGNNDGCNLRCLDGDSDCTCESQNGFECNEDDTCGGRLLKNWGNKICCSFKCERNIINSSSIISLSNINNENLNESNESENNKTIKFTASRQYPIALLIGVFFIGLAFGVLFGMDKTRHAVADFAKKETEFIEDEVKKSTEFLKKEKTVISEKLKKKKTDQKKEKKLQTITPLLENIMESLSDDENKVIMKIIENEGLTKDELKLKTSFSKEKLDYCLLKLTRRQIINTKGDNFNPKIYINDWLK